MIPNKELQKLFGLKKNKTFTFYNIQSHIKKLYIDDLSEHEDIIDIDNNEDEVVQVKKSRKKRK